MWPYKKTKPNVNPLYPDLFEKDPDDESVSYAFFEEGIIRLTKDEKGINLFHIRPYPPRGWKIGDKPLVGMWKKIYNEKHYKPRKVNEDNINK